MKRISFTNTGAPDVLQMEEVPLPQAGPDEVIIKVVYASVNNFDSMARRTGYRITLPYAPGLEVAGTVHSLGKEVTDLKVGDEVTAFVGGGGYAEYAAAKQALVFKLPPAKVRTFDLKEAAAIPMIVPTAYDMLVSIARIRPQDILVVHGAAGGVGLVVGQLARSLGVVTIIGTVGTADKIPYALQYGGYTHVVLRQEYEHKITEIVGPAGVDVVLDPSGRPDSPLLAPFGKVIVFGNADDQLYSTVTAGELLKQNHGVAGYSITNLIATFPARYKESVEAGMQLVQEGKIQPVITATYPLAEAAKAHRSLEGGASTGKIILEI